MMPTGGWMLVHFPDGALLGGGAEGVPSLALLVGLS